MFGLGLSIPAVAARRLAGVVAVPSIISAAQRADMSSATATANAGTNVYTFRYFDRATKAARGIRGEFWNGYASPSAGEQGTGNVLPIRAAFVVNLTYASGVPVPDQSAATLVPCTWAKAASGAADFLFKADGTPASAVEFAGAGGALSGDSFTLSLPSNWRAVCDPTAINLADGEGYFVQTEFDTSGSKTIPTGALQCQGRFNDSRVLNTANKVFDKTWPVATLTGPGCGFVAIWGDSPSGVKNVTVGGDSIGFGNSHSALGVTTITGDAGGVIGAYRCALKQAGIPFNATSIAGDKASVWLSSGKYQHRVGLGRYSRGGTIAVMGHNDRGMPWAGAAGTGFLATYRWYWTTLRAGLPAGAKVVATELFPQAASSPATTDGFATTANMTSAVGAGTPQYVSINPFMAAGVFAPASGDPDAAITSNQYVYLWAASVGGLDIDAAHVKPVCNGQSAPSALWADTTHCKGPVIEGIAPLIAAVLPAKFEI